LIFKERNTDAFPRFLESRFISAFPLGISDIFWKIKGEAGRELALSLIASGSSAPLALLSNIVLARLLGPDAYGSYMAILSLGLLASEMAAFGTGPLLTREIAAAAPMAKIDAVRLAGSWAFRLTGILIFAIVVVLLLLFSAGLGGIPATRWPERAAISCLVVAFVWLVLVAAILAGLGQVAKSQAITNFWKNGLLLLGAVALAFVKLPPPVSAVLSLQVMACCGATLIGVYWIYKVCSGKIFQPSTIRRESLEHNRMSGKWLHSAGFFFVGSAANILLARLDVLIVSAFGGMTAAGLFAAGARISQMAMVTNTVWSAWLQPRMAYQVHRSHMAEVLRTLRIGFAGTFLTTGAVSAVGWIFAPWLMSLLGSGFTEAVQPFRWMLFGCLLWSTSVPFYVFLNMSGHETVMARIRWIQVAITVALCVLLVKSFGAVGAAWAWAGSL